MEFILCIAVSKLRAISRVCCIITCRSAIGLSGHNQRSFNNTMFVSYPNCVLCQMKPGFCQTLKFCFACELETYSALGPTMLQRFLQ